MLRAVLRTCTAERIDVLNPTFHTGFSYSRGEKGEKLRGTVPVLNVPGTWPAYGMSFASSTMVKQIGIHPAIGELGIVKRARENKVAKWETGRDP